MKQKMVWIILVVILVMVSACSIPLDKIPAPTAVLEPTEAKAVEEQATEVQEENAQIANPASVYCAENGGTEETREDEEGNQYGVCIFEDGSECDSWAFFRGECKPGDSLASSSPASEPTYTNDAYGFTLSLPAEWQISDETGNSVLFKRDSYDFFIGFWRVDEERPIFRTGMPSGEFVDGGTIPFLGQELPKRLLVDLDGTVTRLVNYGSGVGVGDLYLTIWLEAGPVEGVEPKYLTVPEEIEMEVDGIVSSFTLTSGETPQIVLP